MAKLANFISVVRVGLPTLHRLDRTQPKQQTTKDQPAAIDACGGDPKLIHFKMSKIKCRRQVSVSEVEAAEAAES